MYKKIFVAIDDSHGSQKALTEAIDLAKSANSHLCIAHAADERLVSQHSMGLGSYIDVERTKQAIRDSSNALLEASEKLAAAAGVQVETRLMEASNQRVAEQIVAGAEAFGADLIIIGSHGQRGFTRFLVGSVADQLVRIAHVSLMMVRAG